MDGRTQWDQLCKQSQIDFCFSDPLLSLNYMFPDEFLPVETKLEFGCLDRWFNNCEQLPLGSLNKIFLGVLKEILVDVLSILPQNLVPPAYIFVHKEGRQPGGKEKHGFGSWADLGLASSALSLTGYVALSSLLDFSEPYFPHS